MLRHAAHHLAARACVRALPAQAARAAHTAMRTAHRSMHHATPRSMAPAAWTRPMAMGSVCARVPIPAVAATGLRAAAYAAWRPLATSPRCAAAEPSLGELDSKTAYKRVVSELQDQDVRERVTLGEFREVCAAHDLGVDEADTLLASLHKSGVFLHYADSKSDALRHYVYLRPEHVRDAVFDALDVDGDQASRRIRGLEWKRDELKEVVDERVAMLNAWHAKARRAANRNVWLGGLALTGQTALLARLTWWEMSWDIIEPVTYFVGFVAVLGGYFWFAVTKTEYTFEALRNRWKQKKLAKYARKSGEVYVEYKVETERVKDELLRVEGELKRLRWAREPVPGIRLEEVHDSEGEYEGYQSH